MQNPIDRVAHTTIFVTPVVAYLLEREIAQWFHYEGSIRELTVPSADALPRSYIN